MNRTQTHLGLRFGAVALILSMCVLFLSPTALANESVVPDESGGIPIDQGPGAWTGNRGSGGEQNDDDDGDSTDPDWFEFTSWTSPRLLIGPTQVSFGYENRPYDRVVNWLLQLVSSQYLRLW